jgi:hypothetical protein
MPYGRFRNKKAPHDWGCCANACPIGPAKSRVRIIAMVNSKAGLDQQNVSLVWSTVQLGLKAALRGCG